MAENVTPADDLSPISAVLAAYHRRCLRQRNGVQEMQDVTAKSAKKISNQRKPRKSSDEQIALHLRYRKIGISAVAAAARYQGSAKNPLATRSDEYSAGIA